MEIETERVAMKLDMRSAEAIDSVNPALADAPIFALLDQSEAGARPVADQFDMAVRAPRRDHEQGK